MEFQTQQEFDGIFRQRPLAIIQGNGDALRVGEYYFMITFFKSQGNNNAGEGELLKYLFGFQHEKDEGFIQDQKRPKVAKFCPNEFNTVFL